MRLIAAARAAGGPFAGLFDFAGRVDLRRLGKKALEMLAASGALDALDSNRRKAFENIEALMAYSGATHDERGSAQVSLFGEATGGAARAAAARRPRTGPRWSGWRRSTPRSASTCRATRSTTSAARCAGRAC